MSATQGGAGREWREQIDPRWTMAAGLLRSMEKSGLSRSGVLATTLDVGIQVESAARRIGGWCSRSDTQQLPHVHAGGHGPPIVFVNGWSASGLVWPQAVIEDLERDHTVLRIDNRGTGWSRRMATPFTIRDMADDVVATLDERGHRRAVVVGLSMGGMISQEVALRHPDRVAHLVLLGTRPPNPAYIPPAADVTARMMSPPPAAQSLDEFFLQRWAGVTGPGFPTLHPEAVREMVRAIVARPTERAAVLDQARAIAAWHGAHRLRHLDVPTSILHGDDDPLIPVVNAMRLARLIPEARYHELPGVGHLVPYEAPAATVEVVRAAAAQAFVAGEPIGARSRHPD